LTLFFVISTKPIWHNDLMEELLVADHATGGEV